MMHEVDDDVVNIEFYISMESEMSIESLPSFSMTSAKKMGSHLSGNISRRKVSSLRMLEKSPQYSVEMENILFVKSYIFIKTGV